MHHARRKLNHALRIGGGTLQLRSKQKSIGLLIDIQGANANFIAARNHLLQILQSIKFKENKGELALNTVTNLTVKIVFLTATRQLHIEFRQYHAVILTRRKRLRLNDLFVVIDFTIADQHNGTLGILQDKGLIRRKGVIDNGQAMETDHHILIGFKVRIVGPAMIQVTEILKQLCAVKLLLL